MHSCQLWKVAFVPLGTNQWNSQPEAGRAASLHWEAEAVSRVAGVVSGCEAPRSTPLPFPSTPTPTATPRTA